MDPGGIGWLLMYMRYLLIPSITSLVQADMFLAEQKWPGFHHGHNICCTTIYYPKSCVFPYQFEVVVCRGVVGILINFSCSSILRIETSKDNWAQLASKRPEYIDIYIYSIILYLYVFTTWRCSSIEPGTPHWTRQPVPLSPCPSGAPPSRFILIWTTHEPGKTCLKWRAWTMVIWQSVHYHGGQVPHWYPQTWKDEGPNYTTTATLRIVPSTLKFHFFGWVFDSSSVNALFTSANVLDDETRWHRNARWNFVQKWNVHIYVHNPKRWCHSCMVVTVVLKTYTLYF